MAELKHSSGKKKNNKKKKTSTDKECATTYCIITPAKRQNPAPPPLPLTVPVMSTSGLRGKNNGSETKKF